MPEWWEGFFEGLWQEAQLGLWTEEDNRAAVDKIERAMGLRQPARILDVPCGDGRISLELAARGHDVTGVDLTERFLTEARRKAHERGVSVRWSAATCGICRSSRSSKSRSTLAEASGTSMRRTTRELPKASIGRSAREGVS